jgi:hypothetical protein
LALANKVKQKLKDNKRRNAVRMQAPMVRAVLQAVERQQMLHTCYFDAPIRSVHAMLASYKIQSMPVKTKDSAEEKGVWIGNIDILDVLTWLMTPFIGYNGDGSPYSIEKYVCNSEVIRRWQRLGSCQVKRLINASQTNLSIPCSKDTQITDLCALPAH